MSQQIINVGSSPNDGAGDPIRTAFIKTNTNFTQLFALPNPTPPATLVGKAGDVPGMYAYDSNYFYYCFGTYNGSTVIWAELAQTGSISVANIVNGTSNVRIASANANVTISVNSVSNVAVFSTAGVVMSGNANALNMYASGVIIANGNVTGGNLKTSGAVSATGNVYGDYIAGTYLTGDGSNISNVAAAGSNTQVQFNNSGKLAGLASFTYNSATSLLSLTGNIKTVGTISTTGNITAPYYIGNGSQLTGLPLIYGNANVANFLPIFTGNVRAENMTATGNVRGNIVISNYLYGDGSNISNIAGSNYGNSNVANYLPSFTGNLTSNNISASGNLSGGNIKTAGIISSTGNITTDGYFIGNFSGNVTGNLIVPGLNTQVLYNDNGNAGASAALTFNSSSNVLSTSGNIYSGNLSAVGTTVSAGNIVAGASTDRIQLAAKYSGTNSAVYMGSLTSGGRFGINYDRGSGVAAFIGGSVATPLTLGEIYTTTGAWSIAGNITGNYFLGNGSQLTGITAINANANTLIGSTLSSNVTTSTLTSVGTLGNLSVTGNVVASGVITSTGTFRLPSYTTAQIANLSAVAGDMVYNTTLNTIQGYQTNATGNITWVSLSVSTYQ
jgi:hypothetical protein